MTPVLFLGCFCLSQLGVTASSASSKQGHATEAPSESCQHAAELSSAGKPGWNVVGWLLPGPPSGRPSPGSEPPATLHGGGLLYVLSCLGTWWRGMGWEAYWPQCACVRQSRHREARRQHLSKAQTQRHVRRGAVLHAGWAQLVPGGGGPQWQQSSGGGAGQVCREPGRTL